MAKKICLNCNKEIITSSRESFKFCCYCGSEKICEEWEAVKDSGEFDKKMERLVQVAKELNELYEKVKPLNKEYVELAKEISKTRCKFKKIISQEDYIKATNQVKCYQFRHPLRELTEENEKKIYGSQMEDK